MKKNLYLFCFISSLLGMTACLDQEDKNWAPQIPYQSNTYFAKDSIFTQDSIDSEKPETGGEFGQTPIKP